MELEEYYYQNQDRIATVQEREWKVALKKCQEHIKWKLRQKTLSGAHAGSRLGADPIDHYLGLAYEKIISGEWEWKENYSLVEQMIRIVDSYINTEVEKSKTKKEKSTKISYKDIEGDFYDLTDSPDSSEEEAILAGRLEIIKKAINGDSQLELFMESVREGLKRSEVAEMLDLQPRQLDKVRERLIRKVRKYNSSQK